jgi:ferredoxin
MAKITFHPSGKTREIKAGATVLAAANQSGLSIGQSCSGDGICGWCRVTILQGEDEMFPPTELEKKLIEEKGFARNERAACLARVKGEIIVTTSYWGS